LSLPDVPTENQLLDRLKRGECTAIAAIYKSHYAIGYHSASNTRVIDFCTDYSW